MAHKSISCWLLVVGCGLAASLGGCEMINKEPPIPHRGDVVAQGYGQLSFRASAAGMVSIYDEKTNSIVNSTGVQPASIVTLNPGTGNITVTDANSGGTQIIYTAVDKSHQYQIWFIPIGGESTTEPQSSPQ